jgi:hypothetical protein
MRELVEQLLRERQYTVRDVFVFALTAEEALVDTIKHGERA